MNIKAYWGYLLLMTGMTLPLHAHALEYIPYVGFEGYQEIKISSDVYFVAFHGQKKAPRKKVKKGWEVHSAQLCKEQGAESFISLKYSFEPVLKGDTPVIGYQGSVDGRYRKVGGFIYVPMFIPSFGNNPLVTAPSYLSHIKCITNKDYVIDKTRLIDVAKIIEEGVSLGWIKSVVTK